MTNDDLKRITEENERLDVILLCERVASDMRLPGLSPEAVAKVKAAMLQALGASR